MKKNKSCDNNSNFDCPITEINRIQTCRKNGYCPITEKLKGCC